MLTPTQAAGIGADESMGLDLGFDVGLGLGLDLSALGEDLLKNLK
jgi:hypothetical protein